MKRPMGATKKLAPTSTPDTSCTHTYTEDEGIQLEVECADCSGAHDLGNTQCVTGVLNVISAGAEPETIILKRFIHKRYRGEVVRQVAMAASELAALNRAIAVTEPPSDKICRTCCASSDRIIAEMKKRLLQSPFGYLSSGGMAEEAIERTISTVTCDRVRICVDRGLSASLIRRC